MSLVSGIYRQVPSEPYGFEGDLALQRRLRRLFRLMGKPSVVQRIANYQVPAGLAKVKENLLSVAEWLS